VRPFLGSIQWKGGQDLCPDTLYELGVAVKTQKRRVMQVAESQARYGKKSSR
jgi:hypothetical protein